MFAITAISANKLTEGELCPKWWVKPCLIWCVK
jgi:hypothetical protein